MRPACGGAVPFEPGAVADAPCPPGSLLLPSPSPPRAYSLRPASRWLAAHSQWLFLAGLLLGFAYAMGWRLPSLDRHPGWDKFPHLINPRLVVEKVVDFDARYGRRYHLPPEAVEEAAPTLAYWFEAYYRTNLKNVRSLGYRRTGNDFDWGGWGLSLGGNERGPALGVGGPHFRPEYHQYLALSLAGVTGYCKVNTYQDTTTLPFFYQYNYPAAVTDTLFLRYASYDYRVYVR